MQFCCLVCRKILHMEQFLHHVIWCALESCCLALPLLPLPAARAARCALGRPALPVPLSPAGSADGWLLSREYVCVCVQQVALQQSAGSAQGSEGSDEWRQRLTEAKPSGKEAEDLAASMRQAEPQSRPCIAGAA